MKKFLMFAAGVAMSAADTYDIEVTSLTTMSLYSMALHVPGKTVSTECASSGSAPLLSMSGSTWSDKFSVDLFTDSKGTSQSKICRTSYGAGYAGLCSFTLRGDAEGVWQTGSCRAEFNKAKTEIRWRWQASPDTPPPVRVYEFEGLSFDTFRPPPIGFNFNRLALVGGHTMFMMGTAPMEKGCGSELPTTWTGTTEETKFTAYARGYQAYNGGQCNFNNAYSTAACKHNLLDAAEGVWQTATCSNEYVTTDYRFRWSWPTPPPPAPTPPPVPTPPPCVTPVSVDLGGMETELVGEAVGMQTELVVNGVSVKNIPELYWGGRVYAASTVSQGSELRLECCEDSPCHFFVMTLQCLPCSLQRDGGYPHILPLEKFDSASCAAKADELPMVAHHRELAPHEIVTIPASTADLEPLVVFELTGAIPDPWCPKIFKGPSLGKPCVCP